MAMAIRGVSSKVLRQFSTTRNLNSATSASASISAVSPLNFDQTPDPHVPKKPNNATSPAAAADSILNLEDVKGLFSAVPTWQLVKSSAMLRLASMDPMVDIGTWVMNSRLVETPVAREVILWTVKKTFFDHFCAGTDMKEVGRTVLKLSDLGLKGMLDYGFEHSTDNLSCDQNLEEFIRTVDSAKSLPPSSVSFVVVKVTALCPIHLLRRISDLLRWEYKNSPSFKLPWKRNTLPVFSDSSPFYHTITRPDPLTPQEEQDLHLSHQRLRKISEKCLESNLPLLIDAEDTSIQPAIDYFTYSTTIEYNRDDNPIIFGTLQAYLKDSKERLLRAKVAADKMGIPLGIKLVRGAYMSSERRLASSLGVESPVHETAQQTHHCYNECASFLLDEVSRGSSSVILATHNVDSGKLAAAKARDLGIGKDTQKLQFAQLYGMADALSFGLRNAGFEVSKYLPFGPVEQIMPYLLRRAEENKGPLSTSALDIQLMRMELKRRFERKYTSLIRY